MCPYDARLKIRGVSLVFPVLNVCIVFTTIFWNDSSAKPGIYWWAVPLDFDGLNPDYLFVALSYRRLFLFCSGHRIRVGSDMKSDDEEKRKNNLNLHLQKSPHCILDSCITDKLPLWTIIFKKFYPMVYILLPPELCSGQSSLISYRLPA